MSLRLTDLQAAFSGVIPCLIATADSTGVPNVSYLSQVIMVDADHVAISNQFFRKTSVNLSENPRATFMLTDPESGRLIRIRAVFVRSESNGPLFERLNATLNAVSAQIGMSDVMRLRRADVFAVSDVELIRSPVVPVEVESPPHLEMVHQATAIIAQQSDAAATIGAALSVLSRVFGIGHSLLLWHDPVQGQLTTIGSHGYSDSGIGSEVRLGEGLIGAAALTGQAIKVNDLTRMQRLGAAIMRRSVEPLSVDNIRLPTLPGALSQMAVPIRFNGTLAGVLYLESAQRLAFTDDVEKAIAIVANHLGGALALQDQLASEAPSADDAPVAVNLAYERLSLVHHRFDDSVFIAGDYFIKGAAGRILVYLIERYLSTGQTQFSNREIRLEPELKLPGQRDNLEARLILLRRRLDEKLSSIRLEPIERGRFRLLVNAEIEVTHQG